MKKMLEEAELSECSFKPKIIENYNSSRTGGDRCKELYALKKKGEYLKEDRKQDEIIMEKDKEEYTFAPKISPKNTKPRTMPKLMSKRQENKYSKYKRPFKKNSKEQASKNEVAEKLVEKEPENANNVPLLFIDVTLKGKHERIVVFEGQMPKELSIDYAKKHSIF